MYGLAREIAVLMRGDPDVREPEDAEWKTVAAPTTDVAILNQLAAESASPQEFIEKLARLGNANE